MNNKGNNIKREVKQLWCIANYYFCEAEKLKDNLQPNFFKQTISDISYNQSDTTIEMEITNEMKFSAHLGSCAIRLSTIEERLKSYGKESKRNQIYAALGKLSDVSQETIQKNTKNNNIFHFFFRNIIAHKEPLGEGKKVYQAMETFFKAQNHNEIYSNISKSLKEIKDDINKIFIN